MNNNNTLDELKEPLVVPEVKRSESVAKTKKLKKKNTKQQKNGVNEEATPAPTKQPPLPKLVLKLEKVRDDVTDRRNMRLVVNKEYVDTALPVYFNWWNVANMSPPEKMRLVIALAKFCPDVLPDPDRYLLIQRVFYPDHPTHVLVQFTVPPQVSGGLGDSIRRTVLGREQLAAMRMLGDLIEIGHEEVSLLDGTRGVVPITFKSLNLAEIREVYQVERVLRWQLRPENRDRYENGFLYGLAQQAYKELQKAGWTEVREIRPLTADSGADLVLDNTKMETMKNTSIWNMLGVKDPDQETQIKVAGIDKRPREEINPDNDIEFDLPDIIDAPVV